MAPEILNADKSSQWRQILAVLAAPFGGHSQLRARNPLDGSRSHTLDSLAGLLLWARGLALLGFRHQVFIASGKTLGSFFADCGAEE
jgi:hypothetical protein